MEHFLWETASNQPSMPPHSPRIHLFQKDPLDGPLGRDFEADIGKWSSILLLDFITPRS
jgi:hypothetical protein